MRMNRYCGGVPDQAIIPICMKKLQILPPDIPQAISNRIPTVHTLANPSDSTHHNAV